MHAQRRPHINLFSSNPPAIHHPSSPALMEKELFLHNPSSSYKPIIILLSHTHNSREYQAAQALAEYIEQHFPAGTAPSLIGLSPCNSTARLHSEVVSTYKIKARALSSPFRPGQRRRWDERMVVARKMCHTSLPMCTTPVTWTYLTATTTIAAAWLSGS